MSNQEPNPPNAWDDIVAGKRLPVTHHESDREADTTRQILLWHKAQEGEPLFTEQQATEFYHRVHTMKRQRERSSKKLWLLIALTLSTSIIAGWYVAHLTPSSTTPAANVPTLKVLPNTPELVVIPAGKFMMGCSAGWDDAAGGCRENEFPAHEVNVPSFAMGKYEVTVGQFKNFVAQTHYETLAEQFQQGCTVADSAQIGQWRIDKTKNWRNAGFAQTDNHPVVCLSWTDAQAYIAWLNQQNQGQYRLPTEAEWEYAARANKVTAYFWGNPANPDVANALGKAGKDQWEYTAPVGSFISNGFGLHDMAGNVWEWTSTCWTNNYSTSSKASTCTNEQLHVRRGGGWDNLPPNIRSAYRSSGSTLERSYVYGFRIARDLD
jgi:formylglycine-generating enzyme required for sulfatase activity